MGFLAPKPTQSAAPTRLTSIQVNQSTYGKPVPLSYGTTRVPINLLWYGDFVAEPVVTKQPSGGKGGGSRSQVSSYNYTAALVMGLCEGPISSIPNVFLDKVYTTFAFFGFTSFLGTLSQSVWSHLTTNHPTEAIPYLGHALAVHPSFDLGNSAALPNISFEVVGLVPSERPNDILIDYCTSPTHGAGFNFLAASNGAATATSFLTYCLAMGYNISPLEAEQRPAVDFINEVLRICNSAAVWSGGFLKFIPYGDETVGSYIPNLTPIYAFGDDDFIYEGNEEPVKVMLKSTSKTYNVVRVQYLDRSRQYNVAIAEAKDEVDIGLNGERIMPTVNMDMICELRVARSVAQIMLQRQLYIRAYFQFKVRFDFCLLEPMDLVAITDTSAGIVNQLVRILEVDDSSDDELMISAEEVPVGPAGAPEYDTQLAAGFLANYGADPGNVSTPALFTAPPLLLRPGSGGGYDLLMAVAGTNAMWGGCLVFVSFDNVQYKFVGQIYGAARYGSIITSTLPATASDPDTTNTLHVQLVRPELELLDGTTADADEMRTVCWVDGEILSYRDSTLVGSGQYDLQYLRRGKYGSQATAHTVGAAKFVRIDQALFRLPYDPGDIGKTLFLKFCSFNIYGQGTQELAAVSPFTHVLRAPFSGLPALDPITYVPRGSAVVVGNRMFKNTAAATAWGDADVYSEQSFKEGCSVSARSMQLNNKAMFGLNTDPITDQSFTSIDYAWYPGDAGSVLQIYENGSLIATVGTYTIDTLLEIAYDGQNVKYYKDSVLQRQVLDPGKLFFFDSAFNTPGSGFREVEFRPLTRAASVPFVARGQCFADMNTIGKLANGASAYDSDVYSSQTYSEGCSLTFQPAQTGATFFIGLNSDPTTDQNFTGLDYAWQCVGSPGSAIYENGVSVLDCGTYTIATVFSIRYDGQVVQYLKDGVVRRQVAAINKSLFLDSSWFSPGARAVNVEFTQLNPGPQVPFLTTGAVLASSRNARIINEIVGTFSSGSFYSRQAHANGCLITAQAEELGSPVSSSCDFGLDTSPAAGGQIDYAWAFTASNCAIFRSGSLQNLFAAHTLDTVLQIAYDGKFVNFIKDGLIVRQFPDPGQTFFGYGIMVSNGPGRGLRNLEFLPYSLTTPDQFIARGQVVISDRSAMKNGGANAWDSDFYSLSGYPQCHLQFKSALISGTNRFMIGLNADPTTDQSFTSIGYAWYADGSIAEIYESGVQISTHGTFTLNTLFVITYDGTNIRYFLDGALIRTVAVSGTMWLDSSFFDTNARGCVSLEFGPGSTVPQLGTLEIAQTAATNLFVTIVNGPTNFGGTTGVVAFVGTIAPGPLPYAWTAVVTLSYNARMNASTGLGTANSVFYDDTPVPDASGPGFLINDNVFIPADTTQRRYMQQGMFNIPAGQSPSFGLSVISSTAGGPVTVDNLRVQLEVIKR